VSGPWPAWPFAGKRERELLEEVLAGDMWGGTGLGPKITALNERFAAYCDTQYGAAVCNGTVSMELCLYAWGVGPGDEVVVPAFTFMATSVAVHRCGATVVYADVDPKTTNLDPSSFEAAVTGKTRAVIPVHLAGHPCDMDPIMEIAEKHGIKVLEDAAQAHGSRCSRTRPRRTAQRTRAARPVPSATPVPSASSSRRTCRAAKAASS